MSLPQDTKHKTLARTRSELAHRSWNLGLAIAFTMFPFSFIFANGHMQWMLIRDVPAAMASWRGRGLLGWVRHPQSASACQRL